VLLYIGLEKHANDKHYSLLQKYVNYGQKSFITLVPSGLDSWAGHLVIVPVGSPLEQGGGRVGRVVVVLVARKPAAAGDGKLFFFVPDAATK
jgi:hypothetical protein